MLALPIAVLLISFAGDGGELLNRAHQLEASGDEAAAIAILEQLLRKDPLSIEARLELARLWLKAGPEGSKNAEFHLEAAGAIRPEEPRAHLLWASLMEERGREREALGSLERAVAYGAEDKEARLRLAGHYFALGDWLRAEHHYRQLANLAPNWVQVRLQLASALERQRRLLDAEEQLRALQMEQPGSKVVTDRLAEFYERTERPALARSLRQRASPPPSPTKRPLRRSRR